MSAATARSAELQFMPRCVVVGFRVLRSAGQGIFTGTTLCLGSKGTEKMADNLERAVDACVTKEY